MTTITQAEAIWQTAVIQAVMKMRPQFPEANGRMNKAQELALSGNVELLGNRSARVTSQSDPLTSYLIQDGRCSCPDAERAPGGLCKHLLAAGIVKRAVQLAKELPVVEQKETTDTYGIPAQFMTQIHGKAYPRCDGLMHLGRNRGMREIKATFTHVADNYVLAEATVVMGDGSKWTEAADSTPDNVGAGVKPHWRRLALTRAKARALRMALGVPLVAAEE